MPRRSRPILLAALTLLLAAVALAGRAAAEPPPTRDFYLPQTKTAADGRSGDHFGVSLALDGDTALIGADQAAVDGRDAQGAAYIFTREGDNWVEKQKLVANDGAAFAQFGAAVALSGQTAIIGAPGVTVHGQESQGAAYIFTRSPAGVWTQQARLVATGGQADDGFGVAVDLQGDTAVVGAYYASTGDQYEHGAAYVFSRSGSAWTQQQELQPDDPAAEARFGVSVALQDNTALVGAYGARIGENRGQGAVYVFARSGSAWTQTQKLADAGGDVDDSFGVSIALHGDTALIGAYLADAAPDFDQGAVFVFNRSAGSWSQTQKLAPTDGRLFDYFGLSVSLQEDTAVIGAPLAIIEENVGQGAAYVYRFNGSSWHQGQKLTDAGGQAQDSFGFATALSGPWILSAAYLADVRGQEDQGSATFFIDDPLGKKLYLPVLLAHP